MSVRPATDPSRAAHVDLGFRYHRPMTAPFDLADLSVAADPYPVYRQLLAHAPVSASRSGRTWHVARHRDVCALLLSPHASSSRIPAIVGTLPETLRAAVEPLTGSLAAWLLFLDPPHHGPLRRVVARSLSMRVIEDMRPRIATLADELVVEALAAQDSRADGARGLDVIADLAYPLPTMIIAELLGAASGERARFKRCADDLSQFLGAPLSPELVRRAQAAVIEMTGYFTELLAEHRRVPRSALLEALLDAQRAMPDLNDAALVANCIMLTFAGHETTTNLIGNSALTLLRHPDQLAALQANPELGTSAIEECMRYQSPVQRISRLTTAPLVFSGQEIPAGRRVIALLGAANRDPEVFAEPDRFDIRRSPNRHLGFGHGAHLCVGATLGRIEAEAAIAALLRHMPNGALGARPGDAWQPRWQPNLGLRALEELPVHESVSAR